MSKKDNYPNDQYNFEEENTQEMNNQSYSKRQNRSDRLESRDCEKQTHTHEYLGSTRLAELEEDPHNHRFAGVTGEAIRSGKSHYHRLETNTDFIDHFHEISDKTGLAIPVGNGKHVHLVSGRTTENDDHRHSYTFATLIENPIGS